MGSGDNPNAETMKVGSCQAIGIVPVISYKNSDFSRLINKSLQAVASIVTSVKFASNYINHCLQWPFLTTLES